MKINMMNIIILVVVAILGALFIFGIGSIISDNWLDVESRNEFDPYDYANTSKYLHNETQGLNRRFNSYSEIQTGSQVKALCNILISNANTYADEINKIPFVSYNDGNNINAWAVVYEKKIVEYNDFLNKLLNMVEVKHNYYIVCSYSSSGVLRGISINYDKQNTKSNFSNIEKNKCEDIDEIFNVELTSGQLINYSKTMINEN
ncbi:MAG: hypothetical protein K6D97_05865 [Clostridia bacterium]|nr:hypothetical protein [Clostridia bacterium]